MCEVSGNRGILILIRQLTTGPSNRPRDPGRRAADEPARGAGAGAGGRAVGQLAQTRRAARGVENLTKISVSAERNALASGSSLSSEGDL